MTGPLGDDEVEAFIERGYHHLERAFTADLAAECVDVLWHLPGLVELDRDDPSTWTEPVVRVQGGGGRALLAAINSLRLVAAIDQLVGLGRWQPRALGYGTFLVRFPSEADPGDAGWHIDGSFGDPPWYRVNLASRGRALLLLMLFTDVGPDDAPTRLRIGSHLDVAASLAGVGDEGCTLDVAAMAPVALSRPVVEATGLAGDVYLCHPFLVHAASWPHRGAQPRFVGQPCIHHPQGEWLGGYDLGRDCAPVPAAVNRALSEGRVTGTRWPAATGRRGRGRAAGGPPPTGSEN